MSFEPYWTGVMLITTVKALYPDLFAWREPPYEYEYERKPIEILCGSRKVIQAMESGAESRQIRDIWQDDIARFRKQREPYLLYE
jgi:uncharacterized protein YbbC (DUF1343 family)